MLLFRKCLGPLLNCFVFPCVCVERETGGGERVGVGGERVGGGEEGGGADPISFY